MKYSKGLDVQIVFIPDMKGWFNTGISINIIQYIIRLEEEKNQMMISIDTVKHLINIHFSF